MTRYHWRPVFEDLQPDTFVETPVRRLDERIWTARYVHDAGHVDLIADYTALTAELRFVPFENNTFQPAETVWQRKYSSLDSMIDQIDRQFYTDHYSGNLTLTHVRMLSHSLYQRITSLGDDHDNRLREQFGNLAENHLRKSKFGHRYIVHREFAVHSCNRIRTPHAHSLYIWVTESPGDKVIHKEVVQCADLVADGWERYQYVRDSLGILAMANLL